MIAQDKPIPADKLKAIRIALEDEDWGEALRVAASWPHHGEHTPAITRGWTAFSRPAFYRQLNQDPDELVRLGVAALKERCVSPVD